MKTTNFLFCSIIFLFSVISTAFAVDGKCYLLVEKSANFDPAVVESMALSIVNKYVDNVEPSPLGGLRALDCSYNVSLSETKDGFFISLSGPKINSLASSELTGMKGFTQALLRAVHKTFTKENRKTQICQAYKTLLAGDCQIVESLFYIYDANGKEIKNRDTVRAGDRFYVMIKPLTPLYAYVISKDSSNSLFKIFPNQQVTDIPNPLNANFRYFFPPQSSELIFEFDHNPGKEKLTFIFSAIPLKEITSYFSSGQALPTEIFEKRILSRGINLATKKKTMNVIMPNRSDQIREVDELKGKGVIVKEILLQHI